MRNFARIAIGITALALVVMGSGTPSFGVAFVFQGAVRDAPQVDPITGCATSRTWAAGDSANFNKITCLASGSCVQPSDNSYCARAFNSNIAATLTGGWASNQDDISQYNSGADNQTVYLLLEHTKNPGTPNYISYYSVASQVASTTDTGNIGNDACTGASALATFCPGSATRRGGSQANTRMGTLSPVGGFNPIPAIKMTGISGGLAHLTWADAFLGNTKDATTIPFKGFNIYRTIDNNGDGTCQAPANNDPGWAKIAQVPGGTLTFDAPVPTFTGTQDCAFYGLRLVFNGPASVASGPDAAAGEVVTGIGANNGALGASSAGAKINPNAVIITNFTATYAGKNTFSLSWSVGSESGISGYYVKRGSSPTGTFARVSELIPATGDGSSYSTLDKVTRKLGTTFYYQLEAVNTDGTTGIVGSATASLPRASIKR